METLNATEPHYIRCIKPNNVLKPAIFENINVVQQLHSGVSTTGTVCIVLLLIINWWHLYFVICVGCFRGSPNKMCRIPYLQEFF